MSRHITRASVRRISAAVLFATLCAVPAAAQQTDSRSGCARDVSRMCRAVMDDGDMKVLSCLQQHRARLSKACEKVLTDNNQ